MARVLKGSHSFTRTPTRSSAIGMTQTCVCLPSLRWYWFTDARRMEGWVDLGAKLPRPRFEPATSRLQVRHSTTQPLAHLVCVLVLFRFGEDKVVHRLIPLRSSATRWRWYRPGASDDAVPRTGQRPQDFHVSPRSETSHSVITVGGTITCFFLWLICRLTLFT